MQRLQFAGGDLWFALVNPLFEAPTAEMRAALPQQVSMAAEIHNAAMGGTLVSGRTAVTATALLSDPKGAWQAVCNPGNSAPLVET